MKKLFVILLFFITVGCAASNPTPPDNTGKTSSQDDTGNFMADVCKNIDFSGLEALGEQDPEKMISCDDLAKCASLQGIAPPDIPCR